MYVFCSQNSYKICFYSVLSLASFPFDTRFLLRLLIGCRHLKADLIFLASHREGGREHTNRIV